MIIWYKDFLHSLKEGTIVIVDTCTAMHPQFHSFLEAVDMDKEEKYKVVIPLDVYLETSKVAVDSKLESAREAAKEALHIFHEGFRNHTLELMGMYAAGTFYADPSIMGSALALSISHNVIVLTQDCALSRDLKKVAKSKAVNATQKVEVYKLGNRGGCVYRFHDLYKEKWPADAAGSFPKTQETSLVIEQRLTFLSPEMKEKML